MDWRVESGRLSHVAWPSHSAATWTQDESGSGLFVIRTWIEIPRGLIFDQIQSTTMRRVEDKENNTNENVLILDVRAQKNTAVLTFRSFSRPVVIRLSLVISSSAPLIFAHPSCFPHKIDLQLYQRSGPLPPYIAVKCELPKIKTGDNPDLRNSVDLEVFFPPDAILSAPLLGVIGKNTGRTKWRFWLGNVQRFSSTLLHRFHLRLSEFEKASVFAIYHNPDVRRISGFEPGTSFNLTAQLGYTQMNYTETRVTPFSMTALSGKLALLYQLAPPFWDLGLNIFSNLQPLSSSNKNVTVRVLGANFRIGYAIPFIKEPWRLVIMPGLSISNMMVSNKSFGYNVYYAAQMYPVLRYTFSNGQGLFTYLKYLPTTSGTHMFTNKEYELAYGAGWSIPTAKTSTLAFSFDASTQKFSPVPAFLAVSKSFTVNVGYGFTP